MADEATPTRRESKGKGKDVESKREETPGHGATVNKDAAGPSLTRMAQSAASFLMSGPPNAGFGGNEKGGSSRTGEALARVGESSVQLRSTPTSGEALKMGQTQEHIAQEEASFAAFLDSGSVPVLSEPTSLHDDGAWQSAVTEPRVSSFTNNMERPTPSIEEQEARDGADVVALLSGDGDLDHVFEHVNAPPSEEDLAGLRKALFDEGADHGASSIAWDDVLNFIPDYLQGHATPGTRQGADVSMHLGALDPEEAWQTWVGQWTRVLTSYQDEVWGDLGALVDEARGELRRIEEAAPGEKPPEPTALLRLRAILGHLRGAL